MNNMPYPAIGLASELYHRLETRDHFYDEYLGRKNWELWRQPESLHLGEMVWLIDFLNKWSSRYEDSSESRQRLLEAIQRVLPFVNALSGQTILRVDLTAEVALSSTVAELVQLVFDAVARCQGRNDATVASKVLHTMSPDLFLMWDKDICAGYALKNRDGHDYAYRFVPRVQKIARHAIYGDADQEKAIGAICRCGHSLAKVLDEYNYAKFTLACEEVWNTELDMREMGN